MLPFLRPANLDSYCDRIEDGWHFHRSKTEYMKELKQGKQTPYIFHMNWNNNGKEKQDLMKESGFWFVQDSCHVSAVPSDIATCCNR